MKKVVVLGIAFTVDAETQEDIEIQAFTQLQEQTGARVLDGFWVEDVAELQEA
jgi:hypothetical protein